MKLTIDNIEQIAKLARLELSEEEKNRYAEQLSVVLDYIEMLNEIDTEGVEETSQVTGLDDVVRDDEEQEISDKARKNFLDLFPEKERNLLKVKGIFNDRD